MYTARSAIIFCHSSALSSLSFFQGSSRQTVPPKQPFFIIFFRARGFIVCTRANSTFSAPNLLLNLFTVPEVRAVGLPAMISSMAADSNSQAAAITSMGVLSHWLYFIHGEHHLKGPLYFQAFLISLFTSLCVQKYFLGMSTRGACIATFLYTCYYSLGLYSSIVIYRLFFHRTRRFPGPKLVVVSKLWHSWLVRNSQNHLVLQRWQEQYGDFVRTGMFQQLA